MYAALKQFFVTKSLANTYIYFCLLLYDKTKDRKGLSKQKQLNKETMLGTCKIVRQIPFVRPQCVMQSLHITFQVRSGSSINEVTKF